MSLDSAGAAPTGARPLVGKRYRCDTCGTELLVLRPGTNPVKCHGAEVVRIDLKPLPASD